MKNFMSDWFIKYSAQNIEDRHVVTPDGGFKYSSDQTGWHPAEIRETFGTVCTEQQTKEHRFLQRSRSSGTWTSYCLFLAL